MQFIRLQSFGMGQTFKNLGYTPIWNNNVIHERGDLLRNETSLWPFLLNISVNWPLNSSACSISEAVIPVPPLLLRGGIPWLCFWLCFFLTIDVRIEVSRICLNVADQVIYIQIVLFPNITLNFSSHSFKFWSEFFTVRLFCFNLSFVSSAQTLWIHSCHSNYKGIDFEGYTSENLTDIEVQL